MRDPWNVKTYGGGALDWSPDLDWQNDGLCREIGSELFFVETGESTVTTMAKRICNGTPGVTEPCPIRSRCLDWALDVDDRWAVLGGTSPRQRRKLAVERNRAAS